MSKDFPIGSRVRLVHSLPDESYPHPGFGEVGTMVDYKDHDNDTYRATLYRIKWDILRSIDYCCGFYKERFELVSLPEEYKQEDSELLEKTDRFELILEL